MITEVKLKEFKIQFDALKVKMENELGMIINIGMITYSENELRCKITGREKEFIKAKAPSLTTDVTNLIGKRFKNVTGGSRVMEVTGSTLGKPNHISVKTLKGKKYIILKEILLGSNYVMIN